MTAMKEGPCGYTHRNGTNRRCQLKGKELMATRQILSPLPGTFYRRPSPDQPPYKEENDPVSVGEVIGLVEVMKTFHQVKADTAGTVARFLIDNEEAVMAGQPIVEVND